jgi:hypothetical protein
MSEEPAVKPVEVPEVHTPEAPEVPTVPEVIAPPVPTTPVIAPTVAQIEEYEAKKAERQLKHWVIKTIVIVIAVAFSCLVAALIWTNVVKAPSGQADTTMLKQFLDTLLEMFKLMKN